MISRTKKVLTALVIAGALAMGVAAPAYAQGNEDDDYPAVTPSPEPAVTITGTITAGATITVTFEAGSFSGFETVSLTLTGEFALSATLANMAKFAVETKPLGTRTSGGDGSVAVNLVLPSNATGVYTITGTSASRPGGVSRSFNVPAAVQVDDNGNVIANTGTDGAMLLTAWVGGGLLVLAGGSILVARMVRRNREGVHS
jgi:hypothetical protein